MVRHRFRGLLPFCLCLIASRQKGRRVEIGSPSWFCTVAHHAAQPPRASRPPLDFIALLPCESTWNGSCVGAGGREGSAASGVSALTTLPSQSPNPPILSRASQRGADDTANKGAEKSAKSGLLVMDYDRALRRRRRRGRRRKRPHDDRRRRGRRRSRMVRMVAHRLGAVVVRVVRVVWRVVRELRTPCGRVSCGRLLVDRRTLRRGASVSAFRRCEGRSAECHACKARDHQLHVVPVVHNTPLSTFFFRCCAGANLPLTSR